MLADVDLPTILTFGAGFMLSMTAVWLLTPLVARIAIRQGIVDVPNHRKVHSRAVPRLGGAAVFSGILIAFALLAAVSGTARELLSPHLRALAFLAGGCVILHLIGLLDDIRGVSPRTKLEFQMVAATLAFLGGFQFLLFRGEVDGGGGLGLAVSIILTLAWCTGITNAVNLIDGLDGLASGISGIALVLLGIISAGHDHMATALTAFIAAGAAFGFLRHNGHPAKIFLGDSGSLLLGFLVATLSIKGTQQGSLLASLVGPLCLLYLPILDVVLAMVRRTQKGLPFTFPDQHHIHHKLLKMGIHHPHAVLILWGVALAVGVLAVALHFLDSANQSLAVNAFAMLLLPLTIRFLGFPELSEYIRSLRNINRRKSTPRRKNVWLRRNLRDLDQCATADSVLDRIRELCDPLGLDSLTITMSCHGKEGKPVIVCDWDRHREQWAGKNEWIPERPETETVACTQPYGNRSGADITVELGRQVWKTRRKSEDAQLWARIIAERLSGAVQLVIFSPGEPEPKYSPSEIT